jgi:hypothetical protein
LFRSFLFFFSVLFDGCFVACGSDAEETGVISYLSKPIADRHISILYLSTFPSAFLMVRLWCFRCFFGALFSTTQLIGCIALQIQEKRLEEALAALHEAKLEVTMHPTPSETPH